MLLGNPILFIHLTMILGHQHISRIWTYFSERIWQSSERLYMSNNKKKPNSPLRKGILFRKFSFLYEVSQQGGDTLGFLPKFLFGDHFILLGNFVISLTKPFSGVRDPREVWDSVGTEDQWESAGDERFWMFHWHGKQERGKNQKQGTLQRFYVRNL